MEKIKEINLTPFDEEASSAIIRNFQGHVLLFIGTKSGQLKVYQDQNSQNIFEYVTPQQAEITCIQFYDFGPFIITGDIRGNIVVYEITKQKVILIHQKHTTQITQICLFKQNKEFFMSVSKDGWIKAFNFVDKQELISIKNPQPILCADISPDNEWIAVGTENGEINLFQISSSELIQNFKSQSNKKINCIRFNPTELQMIAGGKEKVLKFFDMQQIKFVKNSSVNSNDIQNFKFNNKGDKIIVIGSKYLRVYESQSNSSSAIESYETTWKKPKDLIIDNNIIHVVTYNKRSIYVYSLDTNKKQQVKKSKSIIDDKLVSEETELQLLNDLQIKHQKIIQFQQKKLNAITPIINWWFIQKNLKSAVIAVQRVNDHFQIFDLLNMILKNNLLDKMSIQMASLFFEKAITILGSNYKSFNRTSVEYFNQSLKRFTQEIISLKSTPLMTKCDLSREERIKNYDYFLSLIDKAIKLEPFDFLLNKYKDQDLRNQCQTLLDDYTYIIDLIKKSKI